MVLGSQSGKSVATTPSEARPVASENTAASTLTHILSFPNFKRDCSQLLLNSGLIFPSSPLETWSFLKFNVSKINGLLFSSSFFILLNSSCEMFY